jgi:hypothetical protein
MVQIMKGDDSLWLHYIHLQAAHHAEKQELG